MNKNELKQLCVEAHFSSSGLEASVEWAISQIENGIEDLDVCILAGLDSDNHTEIREYSNKILGDEFSVTKADLAEWCGKLLIRLRTRFLNRLINICDLEKQISHLYCILDYPDWMVMLARNCEYSTDIQAFEQPFMDEFDYLTGLWSDFTEYSDFLTHYQRDISNTHDFKD